MTAMTMTSDYNKQKAAVWHGHFTEDVITGQRREKTRASYHCKVPTQTMVMPITVAVPLPARMTLESSRCDHEHCLRTSFHRSYLL